MRDGQVFYQRPLDQRITDWAPEELKKEAVGRPGTVPVDVTLGFLEEVCRATAAHLVSCVDENVRRNRRTKHSSALLMQALCFSR